MERTRPQHKEGADFEKGYFDLGHQQKELEATIAKEIGRPADRKLVLKALGFAAAKHEGQFRDDKTPYVIHPIRVCRMLLSEMGVRSADMLAASLLHDTMEDCGVKEEELAGAFGTGVSTIVKSLSMNFYASKEAYLEHLRDAPKDSKLLKVADRIDNLRNTYLGKNWTKERTAAYVRQTERYVLPLARPADIAELRRIIDLIKGSDA
ncbi:HD domain protein [uncultured archaeon]|nr:HD domain protein [uncultured archaeon]